MLRLAGIFVFHHTARPKVKSNSSRFSQWISGCYDDVQVGAGNVWHFTTSNLTRSWHGHNVFLRPTWGFFAFFFFLLYSSSKSVKEYSYSCRIQSSKKPLWSCESWWKHKIPLFQVPIWRTDSRNFWSLRWLRANTMNGYERKPWVSLISNKKTKSHLPAPNSIQSANSTNRIQVSIKNLAEPWR